MHAVIWFKTSSLDVAAEPENPINPIPGASLLAWLQAKEKGNLEIPDADYEDWGWFTEIEFNGRAYMLGSSAEPADNPGEYHFCLQLKKHRTFKEVILGREKGQCQTDPCCQHFLKLLESEPTFLEIRLER